jgi:hypothetical protein
MKLLAFLFTLFITSLSFANVWEQLIIEIKITDTSGVSSNAFIRVVSNTLERDSLNSTRYLLDEFDLCDKELDANIIFYRHQIKYKSRYKKQHHKSTLSKLVDPFTKSVNSIVHAEVIEITNDNFLMSIDSDHTYEDAKWMKKKAKRVMFQNSYDSVCTYYFYFYSNNDIINQVQSQFEALDFSKMSDRKEFDRLIEKTTRAAAEMKLVALSYCSL